MLVTSAEATRSPVIELIRTLPKTNFCNIMDHSPNQRCCSEVWQGDSTVIFPSRWADSQLSSSLITRLSCATVDPRTNHSRYFESTSTNRVHVFQGRVRGECTGIQEFMHYAPRSERHGTASGYLVFALRSLQRVENKTLPVPKNGILIEGSLNDLTVGPRPYRLRIPFGYFVVECPIDLELCVGSSRKMVSGY